MQPPNYLKIALKMPLKLVNAKINVPVQQLKFHRR